MSKLNLLLASALSVAVAAPAYAVPSIPLVPQASSATLVQWHRGGWGWRHGGGWGWGPWPWIGLGAGVVAGAIIADQAYRPHPGHYYDEGPYDGPYYYPSDYRGDPREICAQNFRSFDWRTGFYTTYSGERRPCPYLREAAVSPDAAPYIDARRPPPAADPYGDPGPPPQGAARPPPAATPYNAAVPPRQSTDPYSDPGPSPQRAARGATPYNSDAAPPPQGAAPYGDASPGDDDEGPPPRDAGEPPGAR